MLVSRLRIAAQFAARSHGDSETGHWKAAVVFDPDVIRLFGLLVAAGARPVYTQTVERARLDYRKKSAKFGGPAAPVAEVAGLNAPGPAGPIPLRLYRPERVESAGPALIYVHGGGWVLGDLDSHDKVCRAIAAQTTCRVAARGLSQLSRPNP